MSEGKKGYEKASGNIPNKYLEVSRDIKICICVSHIGIAKYEGIMIYPEKSLHEEIRFTTNPGRFPRLSLVLRQFKTNAPHGLNLNTAITAI